MRYIDELSIGAKRVFIRSDLDVPIKSGVVTDVHRLESALPTIKHALDAGARVIVAGHLGRPKGKVVADLSMRPVAEALSGLLGVAVTCANDCIGEEVATMVEALRPGSVLMLENVRFNAGEEENDVGFAKQLAALCDVYVNNAFATSHREHASCHEIARHVAEKCAGLTVKHELAMISEALENPARPLVAVFGGAKVSTKIDAIKNVAPRANAVILGGAMANTFLASRGFEVGKSLYEPELLETARETEAALKSLGIDLLLPVDVVIAAKLEPGQKTEVVTVDKIPSNMMALDIGHASVKLFAEQALNSAGTIVWNGPMGAFETDGFSDGTFGLIDTLVNSKARTIVGGGDTDAALEQRHAMDKLYFVSTAGGAFFTLLEGKPLVALEVL